MMFRKREAKFGRYLAEPICHRIQEKDFDFRDVFLLVCRRDNVIQVCKTAATAASVPIF